MCGRKYHQRCFLQLPDHQTDHLCNSQSSSEQSWTERFRTSPQLTPHSFLPKATLKLCSGRVLSRPLLKGTLTAAFVICGEQPCRSLAGKQSPSIRKKHQHEQTQQSLDSTARLHAERILVGPPIIEQHCRQAPGHLAIAFPNPITADSQPIRYTWQYKCR